MTVSSAVDLRRAEVRGRLVQDEQLRSAQDRLQDLDSLPAAERKVADARFRVEVEPVAPARRAYLARDLRAASQRPARFQPSITFSATVIDSTSMNCWWTMPMPSAIACFGSWPESSVPRKTIRARVGPHHSEEHLHQRGLARAVLPEQPENLTRRHVEIDAVIGAHCPISTSRCRSSPGARIRPGESGMAGWRATCPPRASSRGGRDLQLARREALRSRVELLDHRLRHGWVERAFCALPERGAGDRGPCCNHTILNSPRELARLHVLSDGGVHVRPVLDDVGQHQVGRDGGMAEGAAGDVDALLLGGLDDAGLARR